MYVCIRVFHKQRTSCYNYLLSDNHKLSDDRNAFPLANFIIYPYQLAQAYIQNISIHLQKSYIKC